MDYAMLPPEVNSGRIYAGPGPASLSRAAASWATLAAELHSMGNAYSSILSTLEATWRGPSAVQMAVAVTPYAAWLYRTATLAAQTATAATGAVDAYEEALAGTVPPAVVAVNRSELASLVAANTFGQNTPAITAL
jgi:PPE-repeat protein